MRFVFLLYVSRSGSTLLARMISERLANTVVLPEFRIPEWLISQGESRLHTMSTTELYSLIKLDHQRANLGISDRDYFDICKKAVYTNAKVVLERIAESYALNRGRSQDFGTVLVKLGSLIHLVPSIRKIFPDSLFIYVQRDPRGVVNSQISSERPYFPGEKMGRGDAWFAAKAWCMYHQKIERLMRMGAPIHIVRYEQLIAGTDEVLLFVSRLFNSSYPSKEASNEVRLAVGGTEASIHGLVDKAPVNRRINAWCEELSILNGCVIELLTGRFLTRSGYEPYFIPKLGFHNVMAAVIVAYPIHLYKMQMYYFRRGIYYALRWPRLKARTQLVVRRMFDWMKAKCKMEP